MPKLYKFIKAQLASVGQWENVEVSLGSLKVYKFGLIMQYCWARIHWLGNFTDKKYMVWMVWILCMYTPNLQYNAFLGKMIPQGEITRGGGGGGGGGFRKRYIK
jgi:hypothetical protein